MRFFRALISSEDRSADSIIVGGLLCLIVLCTLTAYSVVAQGREFGPWGFASAAGTILGAIGGAKTVRDRFSTAPAASSGDK